MIQQVKILKIIHLSLLTSVTVAYFILGDIFNLTMPKLEGDNLYYTFIPAIAVLISNFIYKKAISKIDKKIDTQQKLAQYQFASIMRWVILQAGAFLILILKPELLVFGLLLLLYLLLVRPTEQKIENELNIRL